MTRNRKIALFLMVLIAGLLLTSVVRAADYKPAVANPELEKAFHELQSGSEETAKVRYLWQNPESWYSRWKMVEDAKSTIDCTYFIIDKDIFGQAFLGLLAKKAKQGIKIRLMIDWRIANSGYMKGMKDKLEELSGYPNIQIRLYNSCVKNFLKLFTDFRQLLASNHDKMLLIDGFRSLIGGKNIGADYFVGKGENDIVYRDTDILMEGQGVAAQLKKAFDDEWGYLKNTLVKPDKINFDDQSARMDLAYRVMSKYISGMGLYDPTKVNLSDKLREALVEMNAEISKYKELTGYASFDMWRGERAKQVKIIDKYSRCGALNGITPALVKFIDASKEEIMIQNPYVVLTETAEAALKRASERGVKIVIHSNSAKSTDAIYCQAFLSEDWMRLLKEMPTLRLMVAPSENERIHSKTFTFDSQLTVIGSYNMDPLSEQVNSEIVAAVLDRPFGTMVRGRIYKDMNPVLEYKIKRERDGKVTPVFGPEQHVDPEMIKKINLIRKLGWLRPLI